MKFITIAAIFILTAALFCACGRESVRVQPASNANLAALNRELAAKDSEIAELRKHEKEHRGEHDTWLEFVTEDCLKSLAVPEPVLPDTSINPVYLRADLDGNPAADTAILVQGQESGARGVVVCRDGKDPRLFGQLARSMPPATGFDGDAFVTHSWSIVGREKTRDIFVGDGKQRLGAAARGESIGFTHDTGNVFIYWDGKALKVVEGF